MALLASVFFGVGAPLAKKLLGGVDPQLLAGLFYLGAGGGLGLWWAVRRGDRGEAPLSRWDAPWLAGAVVSGGVLGPVFLLLGLARTPSSTTSLLLNLEGVFTVVLAWGMFAENIGRRVAFGLALIFGGGVLLSWQGGAGTGDLVGPLAVAAACLCWGIDNNLTKKISGGDPVQIGAIKGLVAGSVNTGMALGMGNGWPAGGFLAGSLSVGFVSYGLSLALFIIALRELGAARTGAYFSVALFIGALTGLVLLGEPFTAAVVAAGAVMAVGVWLTVTERHEHRHVHEAVEHVHRHFHDEHHGHWHGQRRKPGRGPGVFHAHRHVHKRRIHSGPHYPDFHHDHQHS